ncbi:MAG: FemAB family XrtA/PEP-CTERM system-associated protein [Pseudomonadota bacterium]
MTAVRSPLLGRALISTGFSVGGGAIADDDEAYRALAQAAEDEGERFRARFVEWRGGSAPQGWVTKNTVYASFSAPMTRFERDGLLAIPRKRRAEIRKGLDAQARGDLLIRFNGTVEAFYPLYARALRDLGTPVFPSAFLSALSARLNGQVEIAIVESGGAPVAGLVSFYYSGRMMPYYVAVDPSARPLRALDFLCWSMIERGLERGAQAFDFGRSKVGSPHYAYKKHWGFEPAPLAYHYALLTANEVPNVNPNNPKFAMASAMWKRLPLAAANRLGPVLARNFA